MWQLKSPWKAWLAQQFLQHWVERLSVSHDYPKKQNSDNMFVVVFIIRSWFRKPWPQKEDVKVQVCLRAKAGESRCPGSGHQVEKILKSSRLLHTCLKLTTHNIIHNDHSILLYSFHHFKYSFYAKVYIWKDIYPDNV